ncbi:Cell cycle serine/threonine-protein kinase cdc5/MSD2 [Blastocladiella emersonii ATCC 22665]|nr:Cell cycle serine/threonine-protein kinase cdc5/MSD2 [Blastocladiella emersonii ATCC 22665]
MTSYPRSMADYGAPSSSSTRAVQPPSAADIAAQQQREWAQSARALERRDRPAAARHAHPHASLPASSASAAAAPASSAAAATASAPPQAAAQVKQTRSRTVKLSELPLPPEYLTHPKLGYRYKRGELLGTGGFARVYEVTTQDGERMAVKVVAKVSLYNDKHIQKLKYEIKIHSRMQHPNIVDFHTYFEDIDNVYIILELCDSKNLNDMVRARKRLTEPEARFFMHDLLGAVEYMHNGNIIHRDLKLGNLFLSHDMRVKVGDFGLATEIKTENERKKTICGTPNYIAPEVLDTEGDGHSFQVDVWALGVILYSMIIGRPPFQTNDVKKIYRRIKDNDYSFPDAVPIDDDTRDLITCMLDPKPERRPTIPELLQHPYFTRHSIPPALSRALLTTPPMPSRAGRLARQASSGRLAASAMAVATAAERDSGPELHGNGEPEHPEPIPDVMTASVPVRSPPPTQEPAGGNSGSTNGSTTIRHHQNSDMRGTSALEQRRPSPTGSALPPPLPQVPQLPPPSSSSSPPYAYPSSSGSASQAQRPMVASSSPPPPDRYQQQQQQPEPADPYLAVRDRFFHGSTAAGAGHFSPSASSSAAAPAGYTRTFNALLDHQLRSTTTGAPSLTRTRSLNYLNAAAGAAARSDGENGTYRDGKPPSPTQRLKPATRSPSSSPPLRTTSPPTTTRSPPQHPLRRPSPLGSGSNDVAAAGGLAVAAEPQGVYSRGPSRSGSASSLVASTASPLARPLSYPGTPGVDPAAALASPGSERFMNLSITAPAAGEMPPPQPRLQGSLQHRHSAQDLRATTTTTTPYAAARRLARHDEDIIAMPPGSTAERLQQHHEQLRQQSRLARSAMVASATAAAAAPDSPLSMVGRARAAAAQAAADSRMHVDTKMEEAEPEPEPAPTTPAFAAPAPPRQQAPSVVETMHRNLSRAWHLAHQDGGGAVVEIKLESLRVADAADAAPPAVYVAKCIDYSSKFGLGYQLTNGITGVYFNDNTVMVMAPDQHHFEYLYPQQVPSAVAAAAAAAGRRPGPPEGPPGFRRHTHTMQSYPPDLTKKVTLLHHFRDYMETNMLRLAEHAIDRAKTADLEFVAKHWRHGDALVFRLSTHVFQVNFKDHVKLLLAHHGRVAVLIDKDRVKHTVQLADLARVRLQHLERIPVGPLPSRELATDFMHRINIVREFIEELCARRARASDNRAAAVAASASAQASNAPAVDTRPRSYAGPSSAGAASSSIGQSSGTPLFAYHGGGGASSSSSSSGALADGLAASLAASASVAAAQSPYRTRGR